MDDNVIDWRREAAEEEMQTSRRRRVLKSCTWTHHHLSVFCLTFFSYALFHATRKNFSTVKTTMRKNWLPQREPNYTFRIHGNPYSDPKTWNCAEPAVKRGKAAGVHPCFFESANDVVSFEGTLDACFLAAYAIGLYLSGMIGDRFNPRLVLSAGMCLSALLVILFGFFSEVLQYYHTGFYVTIWLLSGLVQACGWPTEVAVMGAWFGRGTRGAVLGLWSACASVGNIIGTLLSAHFLSYGYEYTFLVNGCILFAGGIVIFFGLVVSPSEIGLPEPDAGDKEEGDREERVPISFLRAVLLPGVIAYSLAYACLKLVNYSLFFWLPTYISLRFGWKEATADDLSTYYDWGGIVGGFLGGIVTDYLPFRSPIVIWMLLMSIASLFGYAHASESLWSNRALLGVCGFFIGGPANLISAAVSADLGKQEAVRNSAEALATVTGIIDGTGSVGAALGQVIVPAIINSFSLLYVFYFFIIMTIATIACLLPLLYNEIRDWVRKRNEIAYQTVPTNDDPMLNPGLDQSIGDGERIFGVGGQIEDEPDEEPVAPVL